MIKLNFTSILFDIITVLLIVFFIIIGSKKGFVRSILNLATSTLSIILCFFLNKKISMYIYDFFIKDALFQKIKISLDSTVSENGTEFLESLPSIIKNFINPENTNTIINNFSEVTTNSLETMIKPIIIGLLSAVIFIILYIILKIVFHIIISATNIITKLPAIKQANEFLGGVLGFLESGLILICLSSLARVLSTYFDNIAQIFTESNINSAYLFPMIYNSQVVNYISGLINF